MPRTYDSIDRWLGPLMSVISILFLVVLGGLLHLTEWDQSGGTMRLDLALLLAGLYPLFLVECFVFWLARCPHWKQHLWFCLLPPLRLGGRDHSSGTSIWLPGFGWSVINDDLRDRLQKALSLPLIVFALLVLPLLIFDYFWAAQIRDNPFLQLVSHLAMTTIWLAFTIEFIVMISVVERKTGYCRDHWIDMAIILMPLIAFLRMARLTRLLRLNQLSKSARIYRMRGLLLRSYRALLLLDGIQRLLRRSPDKRLRKLQVVLQAKQAEIDELRAEISLLEAEVARTSAVDGRLTSPSADGGSPPS
ncbi:MAG: hypothetical protein ABGZ17_10470 [Planctomycetaceae bacterium]